MVDKTIEGDSFPPTWRGCANCSYYRENATRRMSEELQLRYGHCWRYPPKIIDSAVGVMMEMRASFMSRDEMGEDVIDEAYYSATKELLGHQPIVAYDDYCGEMFWKRGGSEAETR